MPFWIKPIHVTHHAVIKPLCHLADIRTGYPFRERIDRVQEGGCQIVQMGDVRAETGSVADVQTRVMIPSKPEEHFLKPGEVLFTARGVRNEAATFVAERGPTLAAPHLFILTPKAEWVISDYLTWFLNSPVIQEKLHSFRRGSALPFVPMAAFGQLEVPVPDIVTQQRIADIFRLSLEEERLLTRIKERRRILIDGLLLQATHQNRESELSAFTQHETD